MAEKDKKYYWLKLKRDFFKRHDVQIIESMPNGKDYLLFYLKLMCESIDRDGSLRFSEEIPYNEQMLATITNTNIDIVKSAVKVFTELKMMEILDDGTYYMNEVQKMLGHETKWAEKKRKQRLKGDNVPLLSAECPPLVPLMSDKSKEKEIEIEKEIDIDNNNKNYSMVSDDVSRYIAEKYRMYFSSDVTLFEIEEIAKYIRFLHPYNKKFSQSDKELLEIAFESAVKANAKRLSYLIGVFKTMHRQGIKTIDDYWENLYERDKANGNI